MMKISAYIRHGLIDFELAVRIAIFMATTLFGMAVLLCGVQKAMAAELKSNVVLSGDYIHLGDLFSGVENPTYVLGPAPAPGKDMILNARTLYQISRSLNVDWQPSTNMEQVVLRRDSVVITTDQITSSLQTRIKESGVKDSFSVMLTSGETSVLLPANTATTMDITAFRFDPQNDTFTANIAIPSTQKPIKQVNVSGRIERLVAVPVLRNALRSGDIIGSSDLDYIELPKLRIANGIATNPEDIFGLSPRKSISAGKPIALNDLEKPKMVDRGDAVTLVFQTGFMVLTAKGKSLQPGAIGDMVRVTNLDSNKNLQGIVTADREVTIR